MAVPNQVKNAMTALYNNLMDSGVEGNTMVTVSGTRYKVVARLVSGSIDTLPDIPLVVEFRIVGNT